MTLLGAREAYMVRPTSTKTIVSRLFADSQRPIYIVDAAGRIVFCNQALSDWIGVPEHQIYSTQCLYAGRGRGDGGAATPVWAASLAVPPQIAEHTSHRTKIRAVQPDGAVSTREVTFFALMDASDTVLAVVDDAEAAAAPAPVADPSILHQEVVAMRQAWSQSFRLEQIIGLSPEMKRVRAQVRLAAQASCRVVVHGPTGSGRERVARTIHRERSSDKQMLIPLSCDLLDVELLQSTIETLVKQMAELDDPTTSLLLLLEVDQLSMESQSALLGFLEIPELGLETLATSRSSVLDLAQQGKFRPELAYHLASLEIALPPLASRLEDIPVIAQWCLEHSSRAHQVGGFSNDAVDALLRYNWPREFAELREVVETAANTAKTSVIQREDLPEQIGYAIEAAQLPEVSAEQIDLEAFLSDIERELIVRALTHSKGNRAQSARLLGISRGKLLRRIEQLGIPS